MKTNGNILLIIIFSLIGVLLFAILGFLFYQNQQLVNRISDSETSIPASVTTAPLAEDKKTQESLPSSTPIPSIAAKKPVVIYEAEGSIPLDDRAGIQSRIVEPFIYYHQVETNQPLASITISPNTQSSKSEFPYLFNGIFESGGYNGFVIEKKAGQIVWWVPGCMNGCNLSDTFKSKYPEIAGMAN